MNRFLNALQIVLLCIAAAVSYGILHDQFTVRVCVEYFTVGHLPIFGDQPPTILAILWGTVATWWVGLILGLCLAFAACAKEYPVRTARSLCSPFSSFLFQWLVVR